MSDLAQIRDVGPNRHSSLGEGSRGVLLGPEEVGLLVIEANCWSHNLGRKGERSENF